jgi:DtxR family Mn-dependent transcriptional regulator
MAISPSSSASNTSATRTSVAVEGYLSALYEMASEGVATIGARLSEWLDLTPPTVNGMIRRMARDGLVQLNNRKEILLTKEGEELAASIVRRHRLAERFLVDMLHLEWHRAHEEARRWGHAMSADVEERLAALMANPITCPHGNPIPGAGYIPPKDAISLRDAAEGQRVVVERVFEEIELNRNILEFLDRSGIRPGEHIIVVQIAPYLGTVTVLAGEEKVSLGLRIADKIWVRPAEAA